MQLKEIRDRLEAVINGLYGGDADGGQKSAEWILAGRVEGMDSVLVLRLVLAVEQEFGVVIQDDEIRLDNFAGLDALGLLIQRKVASLSHPDS